MYVVYNLVIYFPILCCKAKRTPYSEELVALSRLREAVKSNVLLSRMLDQPGLRNKAQRHFGHMRQKMRTRQDSVRDTINMFYLSLRQQIIDIELIMFFLICFQSLKQG